MDCSIDHITPVRGGSALCVALTITSGGETESRSVTIAAESYAEMRFLHPYQKAAGRTLAVEQIDLLDEAAEQFAAIEQGLRLLSYGDSTEAALARKLRERGYAPDTAAAAAAQLRERGYIDETAQIERFLRDELRKGRGKTRILAAAREKRYGDAAITHLRDRLSQVDFVEICAAVIEKKYGEFPTDPAARQKAAAALMRLGFSWGEIKAAASQGSEG
ncbi:MAG: RecX family transcriptional regulator [Clostridia bacterium]|nr:RecX family transcriptional regulator [Clostridia bacterium]